MQRRTLAEDRPAREHGSTLFSWAIITLILIFSYSPTALTADTNKLEKLERRTSVVAVCSYTVGTTSMELNANPSIKTRTVSLYTTSGCWWDASTSSPWITIVSPTSSVRGNGTITFRVTENTGPYRSGSIIAGGRVLVVSQKAPFVEATFEMSNSFPLIGEVVTFSVDPILDVQSWNFGEANCKDPEGSGFINCALLPSGACNTYQWTFPTAGEKNVTMVVSDGRDKTRHPTVQDSGECCLADGRPDASFETSAEEIFAGETVYFTDTSSKSGLQTKALSLSWLPSDPEIGDDVTFTLSGVTGSIDRATWNFGEEGCEKPSIGVCEPHPIYGGSCTSFTFAYAAGGTKAIYVDLELAGGGTASLGPVAVDVANSGSCDGGGGGGCSYSLSPTAETFGPEGGSGSFGVSTTTECPWDATTTSSWLTINSGQGTGPGTVAFSVDTHTGFQSRSGIIKVEGKNFRVTQTADLGDTAPTAWVWTVTRVEDENGDPVDQDVATGSERTFSYLFREPGRYRVSMTATNCAGSNSTYNYIAVEDAPVENFVIGAAISQAGANDTQWETDLRFFNPCGELLDVRIEYLPENTDNAGAELFFREFQLQANETRTFADIIEAIPGLSVPVSGSVRIGSTSDSGCKVLSVSRTFNDTPDGSLGLFVPALPVKRVGREFLDVAGLIHNDHYRTNMRLVNYSDEEVWVPLTAYDKGGAQVGERRSVKVRAQSTKQINNIAVEWFGAEEDLAPFSVRAEIDGLDVLALGTVIDNATGDSVLYLSSFFDENQIWLAGVASLQGVNDSQWRTDLWLYNPTNDWLPGEIEFVVGDDPSESYGFAWPTLATHRTKQYLDIVSDQLGLEGTKGYIVATGDDGGPAPQVSARTYNLDSSGGTYGLNLRAFASKDLLQPGEVGYIAGISNSEDQSVGYRTNVGVLNTKRDGWAGVRITMYNLDGSQAAEPFQTQIPPGKLRQFDIFKTLDLNHITMTGSLKIEAISGGAVAVYATEIDNISQDAIFIPAQQLFKGLAR
ncbi:MAG: BACON domain-containing carbohydrate-binding protein [Thermoanaerobaculales bacterium]|nr:BACON domain-containing carbohydrate-binding protein [Thermoanaerobaculales bacterium]